MLARCCLSEVEPSSTVELYQKPAIQTTQMSRFGDLMPSYSSLWGHYEAKQRIQHFFERATEATVFCH